LDLQERLQATLGDNYRLERELGRGGMSRVFVAREQTLGRDVVIKVLPPDMAADVSVERFQREIQVAAGLQHPLIVPVISAGDSEGLPYLVMPFIAGESLRERLARQRELPVGEAVRIMRDVAVALDYAHKRGVVHRDIKPENILLTGGTAVVADFGVAKALAASATAEHPIPVALTSVGVALGTPQYMAPEQAAADPNVDHRADIYAWGVVAYEVLAGAPPFAGRSPQAVLAAHIAEPVQRLELVRPACPAGICDLIMWTLEKRPADRPQTAAELVQALDGSLDSLVSGPTRTGPVIPRRKRPAWLYAAGAAIAILLVASVVYLSSFGGNPPSAAGAVEPAIRSVAVLPFVDAGAGDGADDYFVEGMSDELSAALGRIPGLQVASRTSTYAFKGESVDVRQVGERLKVDAVLEGRVRRAGDRLRVTAQLTNVGTGLSFWTDSYEREVKDVFGVQDDIARAIASALQFRLGAAAAANVGRGQGTESVEAYDLYLRGRYHLHRRGESNLKTAITFLEQAVASDPGFARAHASLAMAEALLPEYTDTVDPSEYNERAEKSAQRALALDSTISEAHTAHGLAHVHGWEWDSAEAAYRRALELDPRNATAHQWYGELANHLGRTQEAVAHMRQAAELEPLAPILAVATAYALLADRQYAASLVEAERGVSLAPELGIAHRGVAMAAVFTGHREKAIAAMRRADELEPNLDLRHSQGIFVLARSGQQDEAAAAFRALQRRGVSRPFVLMWGYLGMGDLNRAAAELERAVDERDQQVTNYSILADPVYDGMRQLPAYRRAVQKMGLPLPPATR
jgi:TolB-like protein/Tfp pilus assembly protein PilF/tRNA A-37 threonylcarbamoyl transferase component Bud32